MAAAATGFRRITVLGIGLVGGSFALAVRKHLPDVRITGWDKQHVLQQAQAAGAIHEGSTELSRVVRGADLVYVALPIGLTIELLPEIARHAEPHALITDACSTKASICRAATGAFKGSARFLGGHPMAGREVGGVANADAELFHGAKYALIGEGDDSETDPRIQGFIALLESLGAQPLWLDAETHDWAAAVVSHLPQMVAVALAGVVREETDETGLPATLAGPGLREMLRLAGSPYAMWRDIGLTNTENIARALDRVSQAIEHLRARLTSRELEDEFVAANELYKILRGLQ